MAGGVYKTIFHFIVNVFIFISIFIQSSLRKCVRGREEEAEILWDSSTSECPDLQLACCLEISGTGDSAVLLIRFGINNLRLVSIYTLSIKSFPSKCLPVPLRSLIGAGGFSQCLPDSCNCQLKKFRFGENHDKPESLMNK